MLAAQFSRCASRVDHPSTTPAGRPRATHVLELRLVAWMQGRAQTVARVAQCETKLTRGNFLSACISLCDRSAVLAGRRAELRLNRESPSGRLPCHPQKFRPQSIAALSSSSMQCLQQRSHEKNSCRLEVIRASTDVFPSAGHWSSPCQQLQQEDRFRKSQLVTKKATLPNR